MKKLVSIGLSFLVLLSALQLTVSRHYCGGELADSRVSIAGNIANCGMEGPTDDCTQPGSHLDSGCCSDNITVYAADHTFAPSFTNFKACSPSVLQVFDIPENMAFLSNSSLLLTNSGAGPPGIYPASAVSLPKICVFRI